MTLYQILGVEKNATQKQIKDAYRKLAMKKHPDHGGDENEFKQLVVAYSILSNEEKRHKYDNGATAEDLNRPSQEENAALKMVIEVFLSLIARAPSVSNLNMFDAVRASIGETLRGIDQDKRKIAKAIERFNNVRKRVIAKGKENVFTQAIDSQIQRANFDIDALDRSYKIGVDGLKILEDYDYDFEAVNTLFSDNFTVSFTNAYNHKDTP